MEDMETRRKFVRWFKGASYEGDKASGMFDGRGIYKYLDGR